MKTLTPLNSLFVFLIWTLITIGPAIYKLSGQTQKLGDNLFVGPAYSLIAASVFLFIVLWMTKSFKKVGITISSIKHRNLLLIPISVIFLILIFLISKDAFSKVEGLHWLLFNCIFIGISEELMFRGILLSGLNSRMTFKNAALIVIVLFGSVHILNTFITGEFGNGLLQVFMASASGILYLAIRVKNLSIVPIIGIHALWDFMAFVFAKATKTFKPDVFLLIVELFLLASPVIFGIIGIYILTRKDTSVEFEHSQNNLF